MEVRQRSAQPTIFGVSEDETRLVKGLMGHFQTLGIFPQVGQLILPKMTLILSESEYDLLSIHFEVNDTYDIIMKDGSINLKKSTEGV